MLGQKVQGAIFLRIVKFSKCNVVGKMNGACLLFKTMMIPEILGTAAMTFGSVCPAHAVTTRDTIKCIFFEQRLLISRAYIFCWYQATTLLDTNRPRFFTIPRAVHLKTDLHTIRRWFSES